MLYTGKGDHGDTTHPDSPKRVSKTDPVIEALGSVDELNAWVGLCRRKSGNDDLRIAGCGLRVAEVLYSVQQDLFIIQAELVGMKRIGGEKVQILESWISAIEQGLPPIKTFFLPGGTELSAMLDVARTVCRRTEREVVRLHEKKPVNEHLLSYLNRLSSVLYALTRLVNHRSGVIEEPPRY